MFSLQVKLWGKFRGEERHQTRIRHSFGLAVVFEFHLKDRSSVRIFPQFKPYQASELASWLNHFYITGDVCPFPALTLVSRLVKKTILLGNTIAGFMSHQIKAACLTLQWNRKGAHPCSHTGHILEVTADSQATQLLETLQESLYWRGDVNAIPRLSLFQASHFCTGHFGWKWQSWQ